MLSFAVLREELQARAPDENSTHYVRDSTYGQLDEPMSTGHVGFECIDVDNLPRGHLATRLYAKCRCHKRRDPAASHRVDHT
jgi:hypothetical protein